MDNLDRTNVAQAAFAKWTLNKQLRTLGILNENETIDGYDELVRDFRESEYLWNTGWFWASSVLTKYFPI